MNIYVGNLSGEVTNDELKVAFEAFGEVISASIIRDKFSGESRGFGFVEMPSKEAAQKAIDGVKEINGRMVTVNEARPREENRGRSSSSRGDFRGNKGRGGFRQDRY